MNILIASNNLHKINEIKEIIFNLATNSINLLSPKDLNINIVPEETGKTLYENAQIKAISFYLSDLLYPQISSKKLLV